MRVGRAEVEAAIASARSKPERNLFLGALLSRATGEEVVVVAGSAVEIYTSGQTSTLDIDIVTSREKAIPVIENWGFVRKSGRVWRQAEWGIDIDLLGPNLSGSRLKLRTFDTPYGTVQVAAVEDLLVRRLAELKHWPTTPKWRQDLVRQVQILLSEYDGRMDEDYLTFISRRDDVVDILADLRRRTRTLSSSKESKTLRPG